MKKLESRERKIFFVMLSCMLFLLMLTSVKTAAYAATLQDNGKVHAVVASGKGEYHKLKVKKSSFVAVYAYGSNKNTQNRRIHITCLKSNKKTAVSSIFTTDIKSQAYFCLKPGTYYIRVKSTAPAYKISAIFQSVKDTAGSSMEKATVLKIGKETKGIVYNTDSMKRQCWYRFRLKKPRKVQISIQKAGGKLGFKITGPAEATKAIAKLKKWKRVTLPAGNYYILLAKPDKKAAKDGAMYSIRLK